MALKPQEISTLRRMVDGKPHSWLTPAMIALLERKKLIRYLYGNEYEITAYGRDAQAMNIAVNH